MNTLHVRTAVGKFDSLSHDAGSNVYRWFAETILVYSPIDYVVQNLTHTGVVIGDDDFPPPFLPGVRE